MIKIGDVFNAEGYGEIRVVDIFISQTTQNKVCLVEDVNSSVGYLVWANELTQ